MTRRHAYAVLWDDPPGGFGSYVFYGTRSGVRRAVALLHPDARITSLKPWDGEGWAYHALRVTHALRRGRRLGVLVDHQIRVSGGQPA